VITMGDRFVLMKLKHAGALGDQAIEVPADGLARHRRQPAPILQSHRPYTRSEKWESVGKESLHSVLARQCGMPAHVSWANLGPAATCWLLPHHLKIPPRVRVAFS
jgi:hypothetical protein